MKKYISYLYALALSSTARSTYLTTFGAGFNAFLGFIFTIIVARSISPANFGLFSVVMNLVVILFVICDVGLSSSILRFLPQVIREGKKEKAGEVIKLSFLATLLIGGLMAIILATFSLPIANLFFIKKELTLPLTIVSVSLLGISLSYLFVSVLQGQQRFLFGVITETSIAFLKVVATLGLLISGRLNLISVLVVYSLTSFTGLILGFLFIRPDFLFAKTNLKLAKTLFGFGIWIALARIANSISGKIDTLMLVRFVETAQVGFYAAAQRMTFIFPVMVTGMTVVLSPKFASLKTLTEVKSFMKKSSLLISSLFLPVIILFFLAPWITVWIYGQVYQPSIYIFRWLLLSSSFFIASTIPITIIIYFLGKSRFFAVLSLLQLLIIVLANLVLIPKLGVIGPAISLAIAYGAVFIISMFFVFKKFRQ